MSWIEDPGVSFFEGLDISSLNVDQAWLNVSTEIGSPPVWLYEVSDNCHYCSFQRQSTDPILSSLPKSFKINTQYASKYRLRTNGSVRWINDDLNDPESLCETRISPGEFGVYKLSLSNSTKCSLDTLLDPVNIYLPLLILAISCVAFFLVNRLFHKLKNFEFSLWTRRQENSEENISNPREDGEISSSLPGRSSVENSVGNQNVIKRRRKQLPEASVEANSDSNLPTTPLISQLQPSTITQERLRSIDAFRGLAICIMIFADDGGGQYFFFEHSSWDGLYVADLAFPWFLWIMGTCIPISIQSQKRRETNSIKILKRIFIRSVKLILLGILVNTSSKCDPVQLSTLRLPGVLQRFGICYFITSILYFSECDSRESENENSSFSRNRWKCVPRIAVLGCIVLHTTIIFCLPVPGCPTGYFGPGGLHLNNKYPSNCIGGATGYIDKLIFSHNHIYQWPTAKKVYKAEAFDPEGAFGILTSIFQVWLGVETGKMFLSIQAPYKRLMKTMCSSVLSASLGLILCGGFANEGWIPINKNLWSLSYVLITSGLAWLVLSCFYFLIDVKKYWSGVGLVEPGSNSILLYVGHEIAHSILPFHFSIGRMNTHFNNLLENLWGTLLWVLISLYLYKKKMFWVV